MNLNWLTKNDKYEKQIAEMNNIIQDMKVKGKQTFDNIAIPSTVYRYMQDISNWIPAIEIAENIENPSRRLLLDIFKTIDSDAKVKGKRQNRINISLLQDHVIKKDGEIQEDLTEFFKNGWFRDIIFNILDAKFYGYTALELDRVVDNKPIFKNLDRYYIQPDHKEVLKSYTDYRGESIDNFPYILYIDNNDLGIYKDVAQYVLYKKTLVRLAMEYTDRYSTPFRIYKIPGGTNPAKIWEMAKFIGAHGFGIFKDGEVDIQEIANNAGVGETIYERLINWCDEQISFLITGETMTDTDGASYAQANVHQQTANATSFLDNLFIQDKVNEILIPFLIKLGFTELIGCKFEYYIDKSLSPTDQIGIDAQLMIHFDIDIEYLEEKYNTKIVKRKDPVAPSFGMQQPIDYSNELDNLYKLKWK